MVGGRTSVSAAARRWPTVAQASSLHPRSSFQHRAHRAEPEVFNRRFDGFDKLPFDFAQGLRHRRQAQDDPERSRTGGIEGQRTQRSHRTQFPGRLETASAQSVQSAVNTPRLGFRSPILLTTDHADDTDPFSRKAAKESLLCELRALCVSVRKD